MSTIPIPRLTPRHIGYAILTGTLHGENVPARQAVRQGGTQAALHVPCNTQRDSLHRHEEHEILLVDRGTGAYRLANNEEVPIQAGQMLILPSGLVHVLLVREFIMLRILLVHPELLLPLDTQRDAMELARVGQALSPRVISDPSYLQLLSLLFEQSAVEYGNRDGLQAPALAFLGRYLAVTLLRLWRLPASSYAQDAAAYRVQRVCSWMDRHALETMALEQLAEMAQLSRSHFCAVFQQLYATSPHAYLRQRRLNLASNMLLDTTLSVLEIATASGFENLSTFDRAFRATFGRTPTAYRTKCKTDRTKGGDEEDIFAAQ